LEFETDLNALLATVRREGNLGVVDFRCGNR
jgi:hypothetical protein